jgi:integrase
MLDRACSRSRSTRATAPTPRKGPVLKPCTLGGIDSRKAAGLVGREVTHGLNMYLARHTSATELRRVAGIDAASQALGHADLNTTLGIYGHRDQTDLETVMDPYAQWLEPERGNEIVPPEADS